MKKSKNSNNNIKYIRNLNRRKKIRKILYIIIIIGVLYNTIYFINTRITKNKYLELFGISLFQMKDNSMKNDLNKNDLVIVKKVDSKDIQVDDIIAYQINGKVRIDKVYKILDSEFVTKANTALYPNSEHISKEKVIGIKQRSIPILGLIINFLQSNVAVVIAFFIVLLSISNISYKEAKYRKRKKKKQVLI